MSGSEDKKVGLAKVKVGGKRQRNEDEQGVFVDR
jgi:hypothetical protein